MNAATAFRFPGSPTATLFALSGALLFCPLSSQGATPGFPMLLSAPAASDASRTAKALPVDRTVARQRAVAIAFEQLDPAAGVAPERLGLELFDGVVVTVKAAHVERRGAGNYTWHGRIEGYDQSHVTLTVVDGYMAGSVSLVDSGARTTASYQIVSGADGTHALRQVNPSGFPADHPPGAENLRAPATLTKSLALEPDARGSTARTQLPAVSGDTGALIDVMVVYSNQTAAAAGAAIGAQIQQAVDVANVAYANSGIATRLQLVHYEQVSYNESGDFGTDLDRLTRGTDGYMDNVATLRNAYGADLVSLFIENPQYCGIAWVGPSASYAFSVINRGCAAGNLSYAHELGHNIGALHDPYVDPSTSPYAYGHGYANPAARWRTVMAYNNVCVAAGTNCARIPYFSNPNLSYGSPASPLGTVATSDNARVHNQNAYTVANFRSSPTSTCTFALSPSSASVGAAASSGAAGVTTGAGCSWNSISSAAWLGIDPSSGTSGSGVLNYSVAANVGPARSGSVNVGGQILTVNQATGCTYVLSPTSATFTASGGTGKATLTTATGCTWTAGSSATWLTVAAPTSGSGPATITYAAAANTGLQRSANLTIGGSTLMVTEAAATATVTPPVAQLSSSTIAFGSQKTGTTSAVKSVTVKNTGGGSLKLTALTAGGTNPADFIRAGTCAVNTALAAGQSCTIQYAFKPAANGTRSATLTIATSAASLKLSLSGQGSKR